MVRRIAVVMTLIVAVGFTGILVAGTAAAGPAASATEADCTNPLLCPSPPNDCTDPNPVICPPAPPTAGDPIVKALDKAIAKLRAAPSTRATALAIRVLTTTKDSYCSRRASRC